MLRLSKVKVKMEWSTSLGTVQAQMLNDFVRVDLVGVFRSCRLK